MVSVKVRNMNRTGMHIFKPQGMKHISCDTLSGGAEPCRRPQHLLFTDQRFYAEASGCPLRYYLRAAPARSDNFDVIIIVISPVLKRIRLKSAFS
jgi:hypothetical protein